jgi:hypothetical protein
MTNPHEIKKNRSIAGTTALALLGLIIAFSTPGGRFRFSRSRRVRTMTVSTG